MIFNKVSYYFLKIVDLILGIRKTEKIVKILCEERVIHKSDRMRKIND